MVTVKICGITKAEDALYSVEHGANALGFVFYEKSKRFITPEKAGVIISEIPPFITTVGVFVNTGSDEIRRYKDISGIDIVQLHGDEDHNFCNQLGINHMKAIRVSGRRDLDSVKYYNTGLILLDNYSQQGYGGTGSTFDWEIIRDFDFGDKRIILSGGLNPDNINGAIRAINPDAVDVSSGVESQPGIKDHKKIKDFLEAVKNEN